MFDQSDFIQRREALIDLMRTRSQSGLILFLGNQDAPANYADNTYAFRQDSSFLYFFGIHEPNCAAVIDLETGDAELFYDRPDEDLRIWIGDSSDMEFSRSGVTRIFPRKDLASHLCGKPVHFLPPYTCQATLELSALTDEKPDTIGKRVSHALIQSVITLREKKSTREIQEIEVAVNQSIAMHKTAIGLSGAGVSERKVMSALSGKALESGSLSFQPILTVHGEILHNHAYMETMQNGQLLLVDAGAETAFGYAGDLTTTIPVSGKFTERQQSIYAIVLDAGRTAASMIKPGISYKSVHIAAAKTIAKGLKDLGLLAGDTEELVAAGAHALFFPHGLGHMMGLDVHDMEGLGEDFVGYNSEKRSSQFGLRSLRLAKKLQSGMVLTVEPGIYFIPMLIERWKREKKFVNFINYDVLESWMPFGGIRNEEDWLVTETGGRCLGSPFDKSPSAIEALYAELH